MTNILVVTHNGLPPSQGGKRLGYRVGDYFVPNGWPEGMVYIPPPPPPEPKLVYASLPTTLFSSSCRTCYTADYTRRKTVETDIGERVVVICARCGLTMRPTY